MEENKRTDQELKELGLEKMEQVSGGTGTSLERDAEEALDRIKLAQQGQEIHQTLAEMKKGREYAQLPLEKFY